MGVVVLKYQGCSVPNTARKDICWEGDPGPSFDLPFAVGEEGGIKPLWDVCRGIHTIAKIKEF